MTIRELAKLAGVSPGTASKALNHAPGISEETCARVNAIAQREGYSIAPRKRMTSAKLASGFKPRVGLIYSDIKSHYYSRLVEGYTRSIREENGIVLSCDAEFSAERAALFCDYLDKKCKVDAILILTFEALDLTALPKTRAMMIANGRVSTPEPWGRGELGIDFFGVDATSGMLEALRTLKEKGHSAIAFIGEMNGTSTLKVFEECMNSLDMPMQREMMRISTHRFEEAGDECMRAMLDEGLHPTAVVCGYDDIALGAARVLLERGFRIPEDVSLLGVDHSQLILPNRRLLASVDSFIESQIDLVVAHMMQRLETNDNEMVCSVAIQSIFRANETIGRAKH